MSIFEMFNSFIELVPSLALLVVALWFFLVFKEITDGYSIHRRERYESFAKHNEENEEIIRIQARLDQLLSQDSSIGQRKGFYYPSGIHCPPLVEWQRILEIAERKEDQ